MVFTLYAVFVLALAPPLLACVRTVGRRVRRFDAARSRWLRRQLLNLRRGSDVELAFRLWPLLLMRACVWRWDITAMAFPSNARTRLQADVVRNHTNLAALAAMQYDFSRTLYDLAVRVETDAERIEQVLAHDKRVLATLTSVLQLHGERTGMMIALPYRSRPESVNLN